MSPRTTLAVAALLVGLATALLLATDEWSVGTHDDGSPRWKYVLEDVHDRNVFQQRGRWLPSGRTPYLAEHSEYPQVATWMLALPYLFIEHHVEPAPKPDNSVAALSRDRAAYFDAYHVMMACWILAAIAAAVAGLVALGRPPAYALLLLLPASLYYGYNRFDVVPAAITGAALWLQLSHRTRAAALVLGVGAMTKWYPILLLPLFCAYEVRRRREGRDGLAAQPLGTALLGGLVVPGLLAGGVCLALLGVTWLWDGGGLEAVTYVYSHHMGRAPNPASVITALVHRWGWVSPDGQPGLERVFTALQFLPAALLALAPVRDRDALLRGCLAVVLGFVAFSKVFSPQWILWINPVALLAAPRSRAVLAFAVVLDLAIYVQSPLLYYEGLSVTAAGFSQSTAFLRACDLRIVLLFAFWAFAVATFLRSSRRAPAGSL